jgi:predicted RNA-binding Zn-ribbon protein involved in translation (DUF1610 family)
VSGTARRGRGRPKGYVVSEETKEKIRRTRAARADGIDTRELPEPTDERTSIDARAAVQERDNDACAGCGEERIVRDAKGRAKGRRPLHVVLLASEEGSDADDLELLALLCPSCRESARLLGVRSSDGIAKRLSGL